MLIKFLFDQTKNSRDFSFVKFENIINGSTLCGNKSRNNITSKTNFRDYFSNMNTEDYWQELWENMSISYGMMKNALIIVKQTNK